MDCCNKRAKDGGNRDRGQECIDKRKQNKKCNVGGPQDCYNVKLSLPFISGDSETSTPQSNNNNIKEPQKKSDKNPYEFLQKIFCPMPTPIIPIQVENEDGHEQDNPQNQIFDLCDNEIISLANQCGEITLSKQCLEDDEKYENLKEHKKAEKQLKKQKIKQGKQRYKECKKRAKMIISKYKNKEKMRKENEKEYFKKCLKNEKKKVEAAKQKEKEKKDIAKAKIKQNKKKHKQKLKKLKERLKQRCEELKYKDPASPNDESESSSADSMEFEDPVELMSAQPPCEKNMKCYNLTSPKEQPMFGYCKMPKQVCVSDKNKKNKFNMQRVTACAT